MFVCLHITLHFATHKVICGEEIICSSHKEKSLENTHSKHKKKEGRIMDHVGSVATEAIIDYVGAVAIQATTCGLCKKVLIPLDFSFKLVN